MCCLMYESFVLKDMSFGLISFNDNLTLFLNINFKTTVDLIFPKSDAFSQSRKLETAFLNTSFSYTLIC